MIPYKMGGYCAKPVRLVKDVDVVDVKPEDGEFRSFSKVFVKLDGKPEEVFHTVPNPSKYKTGDRVGVWIDEFGQAMVLDGEGRVRKTRGGRLVIGNGTCTATMYTHRIMQVIGGLVCLAITLAAVAGMVSPLVGTVSLSVVALIFSAVYTTLTKYIAIHITDEA